MDENNSGNSRRVRTMTRSDPVKPRRRRRRQMSLEMEIERTAKQIYEQGFAEAMKAAALMVVARKLDEVRSLLISSGLAGEVPAFTAVKQLTSSASAQPVANPCVQCGRAGVYRSKPNQFNRTGSWFCRIHQVLAAQTEAEDRMDRVLTPAPVPAPPVVQQPEMFPPTAPNGHAAPGAGSLQAAMGLAEVVE